MTVRIEKKIKGYAVVTPDDKAKESARAAEPAPAAAALTSSAADHPEDIEVTGEGATFPPTATMCHKCSTKALVLMDGCATCLNCGYSKCG